MDSRAKPSNKPPHNTINITLDTLKMIYTSTLDYKPLPLQLRHQHPIPPHRIHTILLRDLTPRRLPGDSFPIRLLQRRRREEFLVRGVCCFISFRFSPSEEEEEQTANDG